MAIKIKRSSGNLAPSELAAGQLAYVEGSTNGGTLYYGEIGGTVREIAGKKFVEKLNGIEAGAQVNTVDSVAGKTGAVTLDSEDITDFNSAVDARITSGAVTGALGFTPISSSEKGANSGVATLDSAGKVPSTQLPSYVDDVLEYSDASAFPGTGETGKIYVAIDTGKTYRWSGSVYVEISASPGSTDAVTEGSTNLYYTDARARASVSVTDAGGDGSLSYDNSTGVFTYSGPGATEYRAAFSAGTGISITDGAISSTITQYADSDARAAISVTQNLSYNSSTGVITGPDLSGYATSSSLAAVATSGSYTDLTNKPSIPSKTSDITNDSGFISDVVQDTTPQLGGDLDVNGKKLVTVSNGSITLSPNGSGSIVLGESSTGAVLARRSAASGTTSFNSNVIVNQRNYTADTLSNMDGHMSAVAFAMRDSAAASSTFARIGGVYSSDNSNHGIALEVSSNNFTSAKRVITFGPGGMSIGDSSTDSQNVTTAAAQDLILSTNGQTDSGLITIKNGANGNIELAPNGTGKVKISGLSYPTADGSANQVLKTDGAGNLSWVTQTSGVTAFTGLSDVPSSFTGSAGYFVRVNSGATALEFTQDLDDGTF